jgi:hypothetical protein
VPAVGTSGMLFVRMTGKLAMKFAFAAAGVVVCSLGLSLLAQTAPPAPTTQPSGGVDAPLKSQSADQVLNQMLKPASNPSRPLQPVPEKAPTDQTSGAGAVNPDAPRVTVLREGTFVFDRIARLTKTQAGQSELTFESDGKALRDPPMIILPNLKLQQMEDQVAASNRDLKFRVTGMVTEYRGRNCILLERAVALDPALQF